MTFQKEDLTGQVDGLATIFNILGSPKKEGFPFEVWQNGQKVHVSEITELSSTSFSTSFTPASGDNLETIYQDDL